MNKPTSLYRFTKSETAKGKYILTERNGKESLQFGKCKIGVDRGKAYILLDPTLKNKAGGRQWDYSLYSTNADLCEAKRKAEGRDNVSKVRITGFNFSEQFHGKAHGDTRSPYLAGGDALLIELSADLQTLSIAVFADSAALAPALYQAWTAGELPLVVDPAPLPEGKTTA